MVLVANRLPDPLRDPALRSMFEARKEVFVDLLGWDVPVLDGRYELDQFDDEHAAYLVIADADGAHLASTRLLQTMRPHIMGSLFPNLCAGLPPAAPDVLEITRFCLDRRGNARTRLEDRNRLVSALVDHALEEGISAYTGVAEVGWLQQILAFGWRCRPLGLPQSVGGAMIGALRIDIDEETPGLLEANGIYRRSGLRSDTRLAA